MYTQALYVKTHLSTAKTNGAIAAKTIKLYQGELQDVKKLRDQHPAIYITPMEGSLAAEIPAVQIDLIVITQSVAFNKQDNAETNLELSEQIIHYLAANPSIAQGEWLIDKELLTIKVLAIDDKYTITQISLSISNLK